LNFEPSSSDLRSLHDTCFEEGLALAIVSMPQKVFVLWPRASSTEKAERLTCCVEITERRNHRRTLQFSDRPAIIAVNKGSIPVDDVSPLTVALSNCTVEGRNDVSIVPSCLYSEKQDERSLSVVNPRDPHLPKIIVKHLHFSVGRGPQTIIYEGGSHPVASVQQLMRTEDSNSSTAPGTLAAVIFFYVCLACCKPIVRIALKVVMVVAETLTAFLRGDFWWEELR
jgi:hypothetical protein